MSEISRRALLLGAPAAFVGVTAGAIATVEATGAETAGFYGLPLAAVHIERAVEAMADPRVMGQWSVTILSGDAEQSWGFRQELRRSEVERAIDLHKQADAAYDALLNREEEIETALRDHPAYEAYPRVRYGYLLSSGGEGERDRRPLYASTLKQLDDLCERDCATTGIIWGEAGRERSRARYQALKKDLSTQLRRRAAIEGASGLSAVRRAKSAANKKLEQAVVGVMLARPRTNAEAAEKRAYVANNLCFKAEWWDGEALMAALHSSLALEA